MSKGLGYAGGLFNRIRLSYVGDYVRLDRQCFEIPLTNFRVFDALDVNLPGTAATDDLEIDSGTHLTTAPTLKSRIVTAANVTGSARVLLPLGFMYRKLAPITLRVNGLVSVLADGNAIATVDFQVATLAAPTAELVTTGPVTINSVTAVNADFTFSETNLENTDVLDIKLDLRLDTTAAVTATLNSVTLLFGKIPS